MFSVRFVNTDYREVRREENWGNIILLITVTGKDIISEYLLKSLKKRSKIFLTGSKLQKRDWRNLKKQSWRNGTSGLEIIKMIWILSIKRFWNYRKRQII